MALLNHAKKELNAKIVFYGPGLSGKTTNLEWIHKKMEPEKRGKLISLETKTDRTLFFDFLPVQIGEISGYRMRFNVYTVPGQIFYNETRKMVLKGADGIVFVGDSQKEMASENVESLKNLGDNLATIDKDMSQVPLVLQYNKRDLPNTLSVEELNSLLNSGGWPFFEAIAVQGEGVLTTLARITRMVAEHLKKTLFHEGSKEDNRPATPPAPAMPARSPEPARVQQVPVRESAGDETPAFLHAVPGTANMTGSPQEPLMGAQDAVCGSAPAPAASLSMAPALQDLMGGPASEDLSAPGAMSLNDSSGFSLGTVSTEPDNGSNRSGAVEIEFTSHGKEDERLDASPGVAGNLLEPLMQENLPVNSENNVWVDPSVISFSQPDQAVDTAPSDRFTVQLEGPSGQEGDEVILPVRIRHEPGGREQVFQIRIRIDPLDPGQPG